MAINSLEELKTASMAVAEDLDAEGEAAAAYRIKGTMADAASSPVELVEKIVDALEFARRLWIQKAAGAKAFQVHKLITAARTLKSP
ncbi:MAG: hypothetical protein AAB074_17715 [Planctomycetota bacterium]